MDIKGKAISQQILEGIAQAVCQIPGRKPCLAVLLVGENPASKVYVSRKIQTCKKIGIPSIFRSLPDSISEKSLIDEIEQLNQSPEVDGILVQLPLPAHIDPDLIAIAISPEKDVDGLHPINMGKLLLGNPTGFVPCTPLGIQTLLAHSNVETAGKQAVILGRSNIVGKPMAALLMQKGPYGNATVTIAHSHTQNIEAITRTADILIAAIGKPGFVTRSMVKETAIVIDVGINRGKTGLLVGDVDYEEIKDHCRLITPVPGGVGPMTIAMLMQNTLKSYRLHVSTKQA